MDDQKSASLNFISNTPLTHSIFPTDPFLCPTIGGSGTGKTYWTFNVLTMDIGESTIDYSNLYVLTPKPKIKYYEVFKGLNKNLSKSTLNNILKLYDQGEKRKELKVTDIPELLDAAVENKNLLNVEKPIKYVCSKNLRYSEIKKNGNSIVICDDCILDKDQELQKEMFVSGRGDGIGGFYLSQSFVDLPSIIKKNASCLAMFDLSDYDLNNIHRTYNTGMPLQQFKSICNKSWEDNQYNCVFINPRLEKHKRVHVNPFNIAPLKNDENQE